MYTDTEERIYSIAIGIASDLVDGDILGDFDRDDTETLHRECFMITLGVCDDDPELSRLEADHVSRIAGDALDDYLRNNPA